MLVTLPFRGIFRLEDTWTESANAEGVASNDRLSGQLDRTAGKGFQLFKQSRHLSHDSMESCGGRELRFHFSTLAGRLRVWGIEGGVVEGVRSGPHLFFFSYTFLISLLLVWSADGTPSTCQKHTALRLLSRLGHAEAAKVTVFRLVFLSAYCPIPGDFKSSVPSTNRDSSLSPSGLQQAGQFPRYQHLGVGRCFSEGRGRCPGSCTMFKGRVASIYQRPAAPLGEDYQKTSPGIAKYSLGGKTTPN